MHYLRSTSDSLALRAILKEPKRARFWDIWQFVFSAVKPFINREIFSTVTKLSFTEFSSLSCEKTSMKVSWPVDELFSYVVINLKLMSTSGLKFFIDTFLGHPVSGYCTATYKLTIWLVNSRLIQAVLDLENAYWALDSVTIKS